MKTYLLSILALIFITGCSSPKNNTPEAIAQAGAQGGIDSSGGDLVKSNDEEFSKALEKSTENLRTAYWRLSEIYTQHAKKCAQCEGLPIRDKKFGMVSWLNTESNPPTTNLRDVLSYENRQKVQDIINNLKFKIQDTECGSKNGDRDASVGANEQICLNRVEIKKVPPENIVLNLTALLGHEVGHILGLNELQAEGIQESLRSFPSMAQADSIGVYKIRSAYESRISQLINMAFDVTYVNDRSSPRAIDNLCKKDPLALTHSISPFSQSTDFFNEYIPSPGFEDSSSEILGKLLQENSAYLKIFNYCNALSGNDDSGIKETKNDIKENAKSIVQQLLKIGEEMVTLKRKIEASFYPSPYIADLNVIDLMYREKASLYLQDPSVGQREIQSVKCSVLANGKTVEFELSKGSKKTIPIETSNNISAYIELSANSNTNYLGKYYFIVDTQVFSPKLNNFWWIQPKQSVMTNTYLDHTYSYLVSGKNESFQIKGDWVHQKNYSTLETISADLQVECKAN